MYIYLKMKINKVIVNIVNNNQIIVHNFNKILCNNNNKQMNFYKMINIKK